METILAPWLVRADALYGDWRDVLHGGHANALDMGRRRAIKLLASAEPTSFFDRLFSTETRLDDAQQKELREVLEILAFAWRVDPHKCVALACEGQRGLTPLSAAPVQPDELLRVAIEAAIADRPPESTEFYKAFFVDWTEATSSEAFKQCKQELVELLGQEPRGHRFELKLELALRDDYRRNALAPMNQLLGAIDRRVFRVTKITLTMKHSSFQLDQLTELFRLLHTFRDTADVRLRLQLCQDMYAAIRLCDWKPLFDLIARKQFPCATTAETKKKWDVEVSCGGFGLDNYPECGRDRWSVLSHARVVAACYSALANAADHVTSIHLESPLADKTSDYRAPVGRNERARWLGYLLRSSVVDTLTIQETALSWHDLEEISAVLTAPTRDACFSRLWEREWTRSYEDEYREYDDTKFKHIDDAEALTFLSNPSEVHGVMRNMGDTTATSAEVNTQDQYVDVFLVGYGQCSIPRSHMALVDAMTEATASRPENKARLKSLTISSDRSLLRLLGLVGKQLEDLTVDAGRSTLDISRLVGILNACPNLRRLHITQLELEATDEDLEDLGLLPGSRHPLKALQVEVKLVGGASGLEMLCQCLIGFGIELREVRIREQSSRHEVDDLAKRAMEEMLRSCCRSCTTMELAYFPVEYFGVLFKRDSTSWPKLETLIFEAVDWKVQTFMDLVSALSVPTHPLAQSLRTLAIGSRRFSERGDQLLSEMLASNRRLVNFRFVTHDFRHTNMGATNGIALQREKTRLTMRQKAAVLSALEASQLPWESFVVAKILRLAIDPEIRQIVVCL